MTQTELGGAHTTIVGGRTGKGSRDHSTASDGEADHSSRYQRQGGCWWKNRSQGAALWRKGKSPALNLIRHVSIGTAHHNNRAGLSGGGIAEMRVKLGAFGGDGVVGVGWRIAPRFVRNHSM